MEIVPCHGQPGRRIFPCAGGPPKMSDGGLLRIPGHATARRPSSVGQDCLNSAIGRWLGYGVEPYRSGMPRPGGLSICSSSFSMWSPTACGNTTAVRMISSKRWENRRMCSMALKTR